MGCPSPFFVGTTSPVATATIDTAVGNGYPQRLAIPINKKPQVHVALLGARQHYSLPRVLHRARMLGRVYTDVYAGDKPWALRFLTAMSPKLRPRIVERFVGRSTEDLPAEKVTSFNTFGMRYRWWQTRRARDLAAISRMYAKASSAFAERVIRHGLLGADVLYSYNGPAVELFRYAKEQGVRCILEQILAPQSIVRTLLREEKERWPGWEPGLYVEDGDGIMERREKEEWRLADLIVAGSSFVIDGIKHCEASDLNFKVVPKGLPYGIPLEEFPLSARQRDGFSRKLRILFAGEVGLRKGVPYLLEALRLLDSQYIEATFAGPVTLSPDRLQPYQRVARFLGPIPRNRMMNLYRSADLFVLPSICEGSAMVTYEALACGLPVICTPNTGSWIRDGIDGLIVPIRDVNALASALERFTSDQEFLRLCFRNVVQDRQRLGLEAYQKRIELIVREVAGHRVG